MTDLTVVNQELSTRLPASEMTGKQALNSASTNVPADAANVSGQPRHWDTNWAHFVLAPKTFGTDGVPIPRRPVIARPENCGAPEGSDKFLWATQYWNGIKFSWAEAVAVVTGQKPFPYTAMGPKHFGLAPHLNNLVILDCDVKDVYAVKRGPRTTALGPVFGNVGVVRRRGIDDLAALCSSLGHDLSELATYTVATPSGGLHLYFHQSAATPIDTTSHHRDGWLIDVIASENNWVAAPPTPGYRVVRDYPVATMPDWLAEALLGLNDRFEPVGGKKRRAADNRVRELRQAVQEREKTFAKGDGSLIGKWVAAQLQLIRMADESGCWNLTIFQVTKDLARFGWDYESVETVILSVANCRDEREERNAVSTIRSGFKNLSRTSGR